YTYKMLNGIIKMGKEKKQLAEDRDINEIEDLLIIIATGVVCDWVIHGGDYDLSDKMVKFISVLRPVIEK
ncbi:MAG: TetR/AcrR family transcriptional regulator C-terminal domain-containing protein, partial [Eubacteriaceae bacterium]